MVRNLAGAAILLAVLSVGPALASQRCNVPLTDWQPREALQKKLTEEGWAVVTIRSDDGCYKVKATNLRGERLEAKYDPGSLEIVKRKIKDGHDD